MAQSSSFALTRLPKTTLLLKDDQRMRRQIDSPLRKGLEHQRQVQIRYTGVCAQSLDERAISRSCALFGRRCRKSRRWMMGRFYVAKSFRFRCCPTRHPNCQWWMGCGASCGRRRSTPAAVVGAILQATNALFLLSVTLFHCVSTS